MVPINYLAVVVSALAAMVIGSLWYGPLFGKRWIALMGFTAEDMAAAKAKGMAKSYMLAAVGSLLMAYVLAHSLVFGSSYFNVTGLPAAFQGAFWNWLGFIAPVTLNTVVWEGKSWKLWILGNGCYLVTLFAMALILVYWV